MQYEHSNTLVPLHLSLSPLMDGHHRRLENPGLEEILEIIDETAELVGTGRELRGC